MTLKFSKQDVGMHISYALVGLGFGYLLGTYISSLLEERRATVEEVERVPKVKAQKVRKTEKIPVDYDEEQLRVLSTEFSLTQIQIQMVKEGLITLDQLEATLLEQGHETYSRSYNVVDGTNKPDLSDLIELEEDEWEELEDYDISPVDIAPFVIRTVEPSPDEYVTWSRILYDPPTGVISKYNGRAFVEATRDCRLHEEEELMDRVATLYGDIDTVWVIDTEEREMWEITEDPENGDEVYDLEPIEDEPIPRRRKRKGEDE